MQPAITHRLARIAVIALWVTLPGGGLHAEPIQSIRMATGAPDGTAWARELKAMGDVVEATTHGQLRLKWYFGGVTGDEIETATRMEHGQLDGMASGGAVCDRIAPTMRVLGIPGLFQSRDEAAYVMHLLRPTLVDEAQHAGYALLVTSGLGPSVIFSRAPIRSMTDLRGTSLWAWDLMDFEVNAERAMGLNLANKGVLDAGRLYETKSVDGFIAAPAAALAFQWSTQARFLTDLRVHYLTACVVIANRLFDRLPPAQQEAVREAFARGDARFEDLGRRMDDQLLGGLFARHGLVPVPVSETFRSQFFEAARQARERLGERLAPAPLVARVLRMLADYRAEHEGRPEK
jgi:TRAP-type C4-dicarboxylate transport system substrate-binding protein